MDPFKVSVYLVEASPRKGSRVGRKENHFSVWSILYPPGLLRIEISTSHLRYLDTEFSEGVSNWNKISVLTSLVWILLSGYLFHFPKLLIDTLH